jgi:hypothetical protein
MAGQLAPPWVLQFLTANGQPLAQGRIYVYVAGTTTPATVYQDAALTQAHPNPVILDAAGRATIFLDSGTYKFEIRNSQDVLEWPPVDNVSSADQLLQTIDTWLEFKGLTVAPAVSPPTKARLFFDLTNNRLRVSTSGGAYGSLVAPVVIPLGGDYTARHTQTTFLPLSDQVTVEVDGTLLGGRPTQLHFMAMGVGSVRLLNVGTLTPVSGSSTTVNSPSGPGRYKTTGLLLAQTIATYRLEAQAATANDAIAVWGAMLVMP